MIYFRNSICSQLERIFKKIKFKKEHDKSIKENIKFFFLRKLKDEASFLGEFHFNVVNGSEDINDIVEIRKKFLIKYEKEIMACLNPVSYSELKSKNVCFSEEENDVLFLLKTLKEQNRLRTFILTSLLKEEEQKKYVLFFQRKDNELNKKFYLNVENLKEVDIEKLIERRKKIILEKIEDRFSLDISLFQEKLELKYELNMELIYQTKNDCLELDLKVVNGDKIKDFNFKGEPYKIANIRMILSNLNIMSKRYKEECDLLKSIFQ